MKQTYSVEGMTCTGCVASVKEKLESFNEIEQAEVSLEKGQAELIVKKELAIGKLQAALPDKYRIHKVVSSPIAKETKQTSKWVQLRPLFLIFLYLYGAAILLNIRDWNISEAMLDFMGLFFIVFSFFKFLDLKGFPVTFRMYDPLAKAVPVYGWLYPFFELTLGLLFLFRYQIVNALIATFLLLGITTIGVIRTLVDKKKIKCACLGTALNLPMTEATFIENAIMLVMAGWMLYEMFL